MARSSDQNGQLSFDIDALIHAAEVEAAPPWQGAPLHFTIGYFAPAALDKAFEQWCFLNGHFDSIAQSHMWHRYRALNEHVELGEHSIDTFTADLRCNDHAHRDPDEECSCVGDIVHLAICEPCGWHLVTGDENTAVEAWHDHALPGWRHLPIVPARVRVRNDKGLTKQAREWIAGHYPPWAQVPGAPIITERSEHATRHVPRYSPWGGYDLSHTAVPAEFRQKSEAPTRRERLAQPEPSARAARSRDLGLGL